MEEKWNDRTRLLIGDKGIEKIENAKVIIFGVGGVGSYTAEALARVGIGEIILVDGDVISISNINRQIHATHNTVGQLKVEAMKQRILEINPNIKVLAISQINENEENLIDNTFSYVVDAVDTVSTKIKLIEKAKQENIPVISAMGAGNKLDPTRFEVSHIEKTSVCPLAKVIRKELKKRNIRKVKVVYSKEEPMKIEGRTPGSISFVPSTVGLIIASEVVKEILK